jgi:hypothetical protein
MSVFRTKGKFVLTTVYFTYKKWKSWYEEILKILRCKTEAIHRILEAISLCMEERFHDSNKKLDVIKARPQIAKVL